jgi:transposase-like protein
MSDVQSTKKQLHMQQWAAIIEDRIASGLKINEYCEKNQLSRNSYFYWLRKIREEMSTSVLPDHNDFLILRSASLLSSGIIADSRKTRRYFSWFTE